MSAQPAPPQRHLQIAPEPKCSQRMSAGLASISTKAAHPGQKSGVGLIELDVALTKLAISKKKANISKAGQVISYKNINNSVELTSSRGFETAFFRWGEANHRRSFVFNEDGSASYMVKLGETIISIVECLLREKHRMFTYYEPTYREIRAEVSSLKAANPEIADLDLLHTGQWVKIPAIVVCEALTGQGRLSA